MKNLFIHLIVVMLSLFSFVGCHETTSEEKDQDTVQAQQKHYQVSQPVPKIDFSLERDIVIQLYKARNERVATHTVWRGDMSVIEGDCPSIGYPIPYDTSLTNPLQIALKGVTGGVHSAVIEQPEPNGLFPSKNSNATWVRCVVDGQESPVYVEGKVTAYPYPLVVDYTTNRVSRAVNAAPSVVLQQR